MIQTAVSDAANCLRIDVAAVEAVVALRSAGVRPLLLKGPVIATWLWPDEAWCRSYNDTDLLVAPDQLSAAAEVLSGLGYRRIPPSGLTFRHGPPKHAECWFRERDVMAVDLHRTIHGTETLDPSRVWEAAIQQAESIDLLGVSAETPGEAFRLLHLVLHVRPKDGPGTRAWIDLDRAIKTIPLARWRSAVLIADQLGLVGSVGPLLRRSEHGPELADSLGLPHRWPLHLRLQYVGDGTEATAFGAEFLRIGWLDRARLALEWVAPSPKRLRDRWPLASRGPIGLAVVYVTRPVLASWHLFRVPRGGRTAAVDRACCMATSRDVMLRGEPVSTTPRCSCSWLTTVKGTAGRMIDVPSGSGASPRSRNG